MHSTNHRRVGSFNRKRLLLSTSLAVAALTSYGRTAFAQQVCNNTGGSTYLCTGASVDRQTINADNAQVTTQAPLTVNSPTLDAIQIGGDGALSFTDNAPGTVLSSGSDDGLDISATGDSGGTDGSVTVDTGATITAGDVGIQTYNGGSGATDVTVRGDVTGSGFSGVSAVTYGDEVSITTTANSVVLGGTNGITARNYGTGASTAVVGGDVEASDYVGVYVLNDTSATDLSITTQAGSLVRSVNGTGMIAFGRGTGETRITVGGDVTATGGDAIYATNQGTGLFVTQAAGSTISGLYNGLDARNSGTGATTVVLGGDVESTANNASGIFVQNAATATDLSFTTLAGSSIAAASYQGITAYNDGTGAETITVGGLLTSTGDNGLFTKNQGTSLTISTGAASSITGRNNGIEAYNYGSGPTTVTVAGDLTGEQEDGIYVTTDNDELLSVSTAAGSSVYGYDNGIDARNYGSGATSVTVGGDVESVTGSAVYAVNGYDTTDLTVTTLAGSSITAGDDDGITAYNYGSGATEITVDGNVAGSGDGTGVLAKTYGSSLSINTGADSVITGGYDGIDAYNYGSGPTTITVAGDVTGAADGIFVSTGYYYYDGGTQNGVAAADAAAAAAAGYDNNITVQSGASVRSTGTGYGDYGIDIYAGSASVTVAGTVSGANAAIAFAVEPENNRLELQPGYSITGDVLAGDGFDTFVLGGTGSATFNVELLGTQFQGFDAAIKEDASTWTLVGTNNGLAAAAVNGGTLLVNGTIGSTVLTVASGATVGGNGTVGGLEVGRGATIAPGVNGSFETLRVNGNATFEQGSTFQVALNDSGRNSALSVDAAAVINGGTINVVATPGLFATSQTYTVISAEGVTGKFDGVQDNLPDIDFVDNYTQNTVTLGFTAEGNGGGGNDGQTPKENALAAVFGAGNAAMNFSETLARRAGLTNVLAPPASAPLGFDKQPERSVALEAVHHADLVEAAPVSVGGLAVWLEGFGEDTDVDDHDDARGYESKSGGVAGGIEYRTGGEGTSAVLGIGGGYSNSDVDVTDGGADIDGGHVGLYASFNSGGLSATGALSYSHFNYDLHRDFTVGGIPFGAHGDADGDAISGYAEAAYNVAPLFNMGGLMLAPAVRLRGVDADRDGFDEDGAGLLNLSVDDDSVSQLFGGLGVKFGMESVLANGAVVKPELALWYEHNFSDDEESSTASIGAVGFETEVFNGDRDRFAVGAGLGVDFTSNVTGHARYDGSFGGDVQSHRGSLGLTVKF